MCKLQRQKKKKNKEEAKEKKQASLILARREKGSKGLGGGPATPIAAGAKLLSLIYMRYFVSRALFYYYYSLFTDRHRRERQRPMRGKGFALYAF